MLDYKNIIIKHYALSLSGSGIARQLGASKSGVNDFLRAFDKCESLSYPLPPGITNYGIAELVYGSVPGSGGRNENIEYPDYEADAELMATRKNMTLVFLWNRFLMMDETPTQILKEDGRRAKTKSYFWVIRTGEDELNPIILYNYTPTRAGENIKKFLTGIAPGFYFMTDGYRGYNKLKEANRCCCWAHVRRYLLEAIPQGMEKDYSNSAVQGVLYCNKLFEYERTYKEMGLSYKQIENRRLKNQKPMIEGFLSWLKQVNPGSNGKLKKAITYIKNCQEYLMTYLEDGRCSLSNNLSENAIRPVTVGRKNWLFSDTAEGAKANALYLTIVEMAKTYNLNLYDYLKFLFEHRPNKDMSDEEFENLAPWNEHV